MIPNISNAKQLIDLLFWDVVHRELSNELVHRELSNELGIKSNSWLLEKCFSRFGLAVLSVVLTAFGLESE